MSASETVDDEAPDRGDGDSPDDRGEGDAPDDRGEGHANPAGTDTGGAARTAGRTLHTRQRILVGLGVFAIAAGVAMPLLWDRWTGPAGLVALVGFLGGFAGFRLAVRRLGDHRRARTPPPVEQRPAVARAGESFDGALRRSRGGTTGQTVQARSQVLERLRTLAASLLVRREGTAESAADDAVAAGTWTEDENAATLLDDQPAPEGDGRWPVGGTDDRFEARVRTAVGALADRAGLEADVEGSDGLEPAVPTGRWVAGGYRTGRWQGVLALGLVALTAAAVTQTAGPALVAAVLVGLAGYARIADPPRATLSVTHAIDAENPAPGSIVRVTVTLENDGERHLPDVRYADGVPAGLSVVSGSPRHATAIGAGGRDTFSYTVRVAPGDHRFEAGYVVIQDPSGERARASRIAADGATVTARPPAVSGSVPLRPKTSGLTGRITTDTGGSGVEFHSVREYRRGDPLDRVDWKRLARTGELATLLGHEERAATIVLLVDVRPVAATAPATGELSARDRARVAAGQLADSLLAEGNRVGLATIADDWSWLAPGGGAGHRERLLERLGTPDAGEDDDPRDRSFGRERYVRQLRRRLPAESQVVAVSPVLDPDAIWICRQLHAHGYEVTLVSPDPTSGPSPGATVDRIERRERLSTLRDAGIRVVDWPHGDSLSATLERARRGWRS